MQSERNNLSERLLNFAAEIIKLIIQLNKTAVGRHIGGQLTRSSTSAGANYEEACGAESRSDFIHKMQIVLKELRESLYWLRLIEKSNLTQASNVEPLTQEAKELTNIIAKSVVTAKKNK
ncbi:MAG: four helix bundle protein [Nitrospinae bacterium]|nr:four helix bundle protein [Nitrospinota bacterium]